MKEELFKFIRENNLSPLNSEKSVIKSPVPNIYKTRDATFAHNKTLSKISDYFVFEETSSLFSFFPFTDNPEILFRRQEFFKEIKSLGFIENSFLKKISRPKAKWRPRYDIIIVTEDHKTFSKLKELNCPVRILINEADVSLLESCDLVHVIDCDEMKGVLESLPQAVFLRSIDEAYLERHLELLSGWANNLEIINRAKVNSSLKHMVEDLLHSLRFISQNESTPISKDSIELKLEKANQEIFEELKNMTLSGESILSILSKNKLPDELKSIISEKIQKYNLPFGVVRMGIPLAIDEEELEKTIKKQNSSEFFNLAEEIKRNSSEIKNIPKKLAQLSDYLIFFDFVSGISQFMQAEMEFPFLSDALSIIDSKNIFLERPQPVSFNLNSDLKCSILTGANSGGKTTLLEHLIQINSLFQMGLPVFGNVSFPLFTEIYYFAKNKGSPNKGAFETLLTQMSKINPSGKTLILADEIEAVTEPGVAGNIISATAEYFINKNCFLVIATHLGQEVQKFLPAKARIDGIEAKGLDENFELIVDHNPVLGRLANSTPELIVERMAKSFDNEYFKFLNKRLKKD